MTETAPILMERRSNGLAPKSLMDAQALDRFSFGKALKVRVTQPRSVPHHRLYWAMLGKVAENLENTTDEALHEWVKLNTGHTSPVRLANGETVYVPGSIAFDEMDQAAFRAFFDKAMDLICTQVIPRLRKADLEREARLMLGERAA